MYVLTPSEQVATSKDRKPREDLSDKIPNFLRLGVPSSKSWEASRKGIGAKEKQIKNTPNANRSSKYSARVKKRWKGGQIDFLGEKSELESSESVQGPLAQKQI